MHRPVCITYDSTCDLTPQLLERFRIRTVPLTIQSGKRVFPDDGRYTSADLYADYRSRGTLPKTAAVSPEEFKSFFAPILAEGYDIVHIDISAELSCTCQNAVLAAQELTERGEIHVVDSRQLSTGGGLLALQGAKLRDSGMAAADIAAELRRLAPHSDTSFVLDTLEYMWKGGRCSGVAALGANLLPGDELLSVDGNELNDTLDYDFYTDSKSFHLKARVADGIREWDVRREERGPFGCDFSTYLGDQKHSCSNHCMFCFIDQLPPGMRESLYFKDDDERLSFLFGNYITMTNMQDHEIDRIIKMHISPINISVHTTNPQLRVRMLANKRGGEVLKYLPRLVEGGIAVNCQLVLCRGINDGDELRRTLTDLLELTPMVQSVAAVPCGVTDYRQNLFKQTPYDAETSAAVIDIMEEFGDECKRRHGKRIIYPSDEWYLKAGRPIPEPEFYEDYDQLENGVGMMSLFREEFLAELEKPHRIYGTKKMDVVTGTMAAPLITEMMDELHRQYPMIEVKVHPIKNNFFGGNVGVAGLVTATDIIAQCEGRLSSGTLGVPAVMLREEKDTFLDDMTIEQLGQRLGVKVEVLPTGGGDEAKALLRSGLHIARRRRP